ncbi:MAG: aminotransferase class III-fold pyridoxal phosphate-dependent enzyme [Cyanobacteria bacterium P01_A01_bin.83]
MQASRPRLPKITQGKNDLLVTATGQQYIDLFSANGAVWLGHCHPAIVDGVKEQLDNIWLTGALGTPIHDQALQLLSTFFPETHQVSGIYSTGMEAAEFAIRVARASTQRNGLIGFEGCMHGKSLATAYLGWNNRDRLEIPFIYRLPFVSCCQEAEIIEQLEAVLKQRAIAAVLIEPFQASAGGHRASDNFYQTLYRLCQQYQTLLIFDEILTGFYRQGSPFFFSGLGFVPDIILLGKSIGNGFPASAVVVNRQYPIEPKMLPGSTFSNNPLAAAAIVATLKQMKSQDILKKVELIHRLITKSLQDLTGLGVAVHGEGTLWVLELPEDLDVEAIINNIYQRGVIVNHTRNLIRLLPAVTIKLQHLETACGIILDELKKADGQGRTPA